VSAVEVGRPYGVWPTLGFSFLIVIVYLLGIFLAYVSFAIVEMMANPSIAEKELVNLLTTSGDYMIYATIVASFMSLLTTVFVCHRAQNYSLTEYLKLYFPHSRTFVQWFGLFLVFFFLADVVFRMTGETGGEDFINQTMSLTDNRLMVWLLIVVIAPVFEEVFFRGLLLEGLRYSKLGNIGAVMITSLLWALVHTQYNWFIVFWVFLFGILLGYARIRSNSLYLVIILHAVNNLLSTLQVSV